MKTRCLTGFVAVCLGVALIANAAEPPAPKGAAASCVACARSCPGRCVVQDGSCVCSASSQRSNVDDCYAACARKAGADASTLEKCRSDCSPPQP